MTALEFANQLLEDARYRDAATFTDDYRTTLFLATMVVREADQRPITTRRKILRHWEHTPKAPEFTCRVHHGPLSECRDRHQQDGRVPDFPEVMVAIIILTGLLLLAFLC